jgi:hypothetical protein
LNQMQWKTGWLRTQNNTRLTTVLLCIQNVYLIKLSFWRNCVTGIMTDRIRDVNRMQHNECVWPGVQDGPSERKDSRSKVQNCGPQLFPTQRPIKQQCIFRRLSRTVQTTINLQILYCRMLFTKKITA